MGTVRVRHLVEHRSGFYFQATPAMRKVGMVSEPLGTDRAKAIARAEELNRTWDAIRNGGSESGATITVGRLIGEYEKSSWYLRLAPKTKQEVDQAMRVVSAGIGPKHAVRSVRRRHVRDFHDKLYQAKGLHHANKVVKWLRRLLAFAVDAEYIVRNPASDMDLPQPKPRRHVWAPAQVQRFIAAADDEGCSGWGTAVAIAYDSAQRLSDILALRWDAYDGEDITVRQGKTDVQVWCPLWPETIERLNALKHTNAAAKRPSTHIVTGERGRPIRQQTYFSKRFRALAAKVELPVGLQFRDLRRTAASEVMAGGGRSEPITGHRPGSPTLKIYEVPDKDAARSAQASRAQVRNKKFES